MVRGGRAITWAAVERLRASGVVDPSIVPALPLAAEAMVGVGDLEGGNTLADEARVPWEATDRPWARVTAARATRSLRRQAATSVRRSTASRGPIRRSPPGRSVPAGADEPLQGTLPRRAKKRAGARRAIEAAIAAFTMIGTPLERAHASSSARIPSSAGVLTRRSQVAWLAAFGATNREIVSRLFISVKTVEANLSRSYRKLASLAHRAGPAPRGR